MATKTQTAQIEDFDYSIAEGTNQEYVDVYPRIQWHHGKKQLAKVGGVVATGGLFIGKDQFPNLEAEGWQPDSFTSQSGEEVQGFSTNRGHLAVIRYKTWWTEYDDGSKSSQTHFLCVVKGVPGLFSLQVSGVSKGQPMIQAFNDHRNQVVAMVNRNKPQGANNFEPFALWFVVEPSETEMQRSAKKADSQSEVTKPRLYVPETLDLDYARTLWVGREHYKLFAEMYRETKAWQTQFPRSRVNDTPDPDAPAFSGPDNANGITAGQADMIAGLLQVKNVDKPELEEFCLRATSGATSNYQLLTQDEAREVIELLKAF
jgi:hypothetical protein